MPNWKKIREKKRFKAFNEFATQGPPNSPRYIEYVKSALQKNGLKIAAVVNPSEELCLLAVNQNGNAIAHIKNPSSAVKLAAVQQNGLAIRFIPNSSLTVQLAAVRQNARAIRYMVDLTYEIKLAAAKQNGLVLGSKHFRNVPYEILLAGVEQNGINIVFILERNLPIELLNSLCVAAIKSSGCAAIRCIPNPSLELQYLAIKRDEDSIYFIANLYHEAYVYHVFLYGNNNLPTYDELLTR